MTPSADATPGRKILCLAGFMGSGKTTVGRLLARQLGWHFTDLDQQIERAAGLSISAIFERRGEPAFRDTEHTALEQILGRARARTQSTVVALGGGTVAQPRNLPLLAGTMVVWLDCPLEVLLLRCVGMPNRPLFRDEQSFQELYDLRRPFYERAGIRVDGDANPRRVVEQILALGIHDKVNA